VTLVAMWEGLVRADVRFVVIGGVAATAQGSVRITEDLDICYDPAPDNAGRLARLLSDWNARLYLPREPDTQLPFVIDAKTFRDAPNLTLVTDLGRLDLLGLVTGLGGYSVALSASEVVHVGAVDLRVLTLDALIASKRAAGHQQDRDDLIELEAIRALKQLQTKAAPTRSRQRR